MAYQVSRSSNSRDSSPNPYSEESGESDDSTTNSRNKDENTSSSRLPEIEAENSNECAVSSSESESSTSTDSINESPSPSTDSMNEDFEFYYQMRQSNISATLGIDSVYAERDAPLRVIRKLPSKRGFNTKKSGSSKDNASGTYNVKTDDSDVSTKKSELKEDGSSSSKHQNTDSETAGSKENNSEGAEDGTLNEHQNADSESNSSEESYSERSESRESNPLSNKSGDKESTDTETGESKENSEESDSTVDSSSSEHQNTDSESTASKESYSKRSECTVGNTLSNKRESNDIYTDSESNASVESYSKRSECREGNTLSNKLESTIIETGVSKEKNSDSAQDVSKENNSEKSESAEDSTSTIKRENTASETDESTSSEKLFSRGNADELKYISAKKCATSSSRQRNKSKLSISKSELEKVLPESSETRFTKPKKSPTVALRGKKTKNSTISSKQTPSTSRIRGRKNTKPGDEEASMYLKVDSSESLSPDHAIGFSSQKSYTAVSSKCTPKTTPSRKRTKNKPPSCGTLATPNIHESESSNLETLELDAKPTKRGRKSSRGRGRGKAKSAPGASSRGRVRKQSQTRGASKSSRRGRIVSTLEASDENEQASDENEQVSSPEECRRRGRRAAPQRNATVTTETVSTVLEERGMRSETFYNPKTKKYKSEYRGKDSNLLLVTTETEAIFTEKDLLPGSSMDLPSCSYQSRTPEHEGNTEASSLNPKEEDSSPGSLETEAYGTIRETITEDCTLPSKFKNTETDDSQDSESEKFEFTKGNTSYIQSTDSETDELKEHNSKISERIQYIRQDKTAITGTHKKCTKSKLFGKGKNSRTRPENYPEPDLYRSEKKSETSLECIGESSFTDRNNPVTRVKYSKGLSRTRGSKQKTPSNYAKEQPSKPKQRQFHDERRTLHAKEWDSPGTSDECEMPTNEHIKKSSLKYEPEQYEALDLTTSKVKEQKYLGSDGSLTGEEISDDVDEVATTVEDSEDSSLNGNLELQSEIDYITVDQVREALAVMRAKSLRFYDHLLLEMNTNSEIYLIVKSLRESTISGRTLPLDYSEISLKKLEAEKQLKTFYKPSQSKTKTRHFKGNTRKVSTTANSNASSRSESIKLPQSFQQGSTVPSRQNQLEGSGDSFDENFNKVIVMLETEMKRCRVESSDSEVQNKFESFGSKLYDRFEPLNSDLPEVSNRILEEDLYLSGSTSKSSEGSPKENIGRLPLHNLTFKSTSKSEEGVEGQQEVCESESKSSESQESSEDSSEKSTEDSTSNSTPIPSESVERQQEVNKSEFKSSESHESSGSSEKSTGEDSKSKSTPTSSESDEDTKSQEQNATFESETQLSEYERSLDESSETSSEESTGQSLELESAAMHPNTTKRNKPKKSSDIQASKVKSKSILSTSSESQDASEVLSPRKRPRTGKVSEKEIKNGTQSVRDSRKRHASEKDFLSKRKRNAEDH